MKYIIQKRVAISLLLMSLTGIFGLLAGNMEPKHKTDSISQSVGLVLSGGGAKGIAHVGVIKALEDNDIPIDYVTGTSMGAIVGSLYSCGWSPQQMMKFFTSKDFSYWSTGTINPDNKVYFSEPEKSPDIFKINLSFKDSSIFQTHIIPSSLISPIPMNIEFVKLFSPYTEQCGQNFNNLFVPFRCVTSDIYHKHKIVLSKGSLGMSVRASMSFPLVFKPIELDGVLVYDGGIYDNFPVDVMREDFNPDFIIGVSVSAPDSKPQPGNIYSQLEDMIIQNNDYSVPSKNGIKIQVPVLNYGVLDFGKADVIYNIGYKTGLSMVDSIKKRISARRPLEDVTAKREYFASKTPVVNFDSVTVTSNSAKASDYIEYIVTNGGKNLPLDMQQAEKGYYELVNTDIFNDLYPSVKFNADSTTNLLLKASLKGGWSFGFGGWLTSSTNSFLCVNAGYRTVGFKALNANFTGWIGQTYYAMQIQGSMAIRSRIPSRLKFTAVFSRQKYYDNEILFFKQHAPTFISEWQAFANLEYSWKMGNKGKGFVGLGYGLIWDSFFNSNVTDYSAAKKSKAYNKAAALTLGYEHNTLNNFLYPSAGDEILAKGYVSVEDSKYIPEGDESLSGGYVAYPKGRIEALWRSYFSFGKHFSLGIYANAMMTFTHLNRNYTVSLIENPAFAPLPSMKNYFNKGFRSGSYLATGLSPVWMPLSNLQIRGDFFGYFPMRNEIENAKGNLAYDGWFRRAEFMGEVSAVYNFSFASLAVYCNYLSYPAKNWNVGISFGIFLQAPKFGQ